MQITIADKIYRDLEAAIGRQGGDVPGVIEQVLARLAERLQHDPAALPAKLQAAVDAIRNRGDSEPLTGSAGDSARAQFKDRVEALQASFAEANPEKLQQWIDQTVDEVEGEFRQRSLDANPA